MNSMGKNSIQIRHEINKGLCRAKHGKTNNRDIHLCTLKPLVWKQVGLQSPQINIILTMPLLYAIRVITKLPNSERTM
jgi:hypothetical protein